MDLYNCTNEQSTACDVKIDYFLTPLTFNNTYEYILFICQNEILLQNIIDLFMHHRIKHIMLCLIKKKMNYDKSLV